MKKDEIIRLFRKWLGDNESKIKEREKAAKGLLDEFFSLFGSVEQLENMDIRRDYAFKTGMKDSKTLCNLVDYKTDLLGINRVIGQSGYQRYGVQLTSDDKWLFRSYKKYPENEREQKAREIFEGYKDETIKLFEMVESGDLSEFDDIKMPQLHKNKLHFLFSRGTTISIYAGPDLNKILEAIDIQFSKQISTFRKRELLLSFIKANFGNDDRYPYLFSCFLYDEDGIRFFMRPKNYVVEPLLEAPQRKEINLNTPVRATGDNLESNDTNDGTTAEEIVYDYLKTNMDLLNINSIDDIYRVHLNPMLRIHCDLMYVDKNGEKHYIEVKSSKIKNLNKPKFYMSAYEYEFMKNNEDKYLLFYVGNVLKNKNRIKTITPQQIKDCCNPYQYLFS